MSSKPTVLVVDDSAFMRRMVSDLVESSGEFTVVGTARDGQDALARVRALNPDVVTLDIEMPVMSGLQALEAIMRDSPRRVVMLSAAETVDGRNATLRALELGAVDFVRKPSGPISLDLDMVRLRLLDALRAAAQANMRASSGGAAGAAASPVQRVLVTGARGATSEWRAVAIAASTGGPRALTRVLPALPANLPAAVFVVQHMPPGFTLSLARRLDSMGPLPVHEAESGQMVQSGHVYVATGGQHMRVVNSAAPTIALEKSPPMWGVRPAADPLFHSVAEVFGGNSVAVVLTGMGHDGADGARAIRGAGGKTVIQDRESSTVYGMPQAALQAAGADRVASLDGVAQAVVEMLESLRRPA